MAKGYQYREYAGFPELALGQELATVVQLGLPEVADNGEGLHSVIKLLGVSEHPSYQKYHVTHEVLRRVKWRFHDEIRFQLVTIEEFPLFLAQNGDHLLAMTNENLCDEFLDRLQDQCPQLRYAKPEVDLKELRQAQHMHVRGGWFGGLEIPDVRSAAIFGPNVSDSDDWGRYERSGQVTVLTMQVRFRDEEPLVSVTAGGGVVVFSAYPEQDALELVRAVQALVKPYAHIIKDWLDPKTPG